MKTPAQTTKTTLREAFERAFAKYKLPIKGNVGIIPWRMKR